jgi:hypothetical protein
VVEAQLVGSLADQVVPAVVRHVLLSVSWALALDVRWAWVENEAEMAVSVLDAEDAIALQAERRLALELSFDQTFSSAAMVGVEEVGADMMAAGPQVVPVSRCQDAVWQQRESYAALAPPAFSFDS